MYKLAVVILNWNGKEHLKTFLPSVEKHTSGENIKLFVADNGSTDNSVDFLKKYHPGIECILLDKNYGFAGGYNKALRSIDSEYFVLLNSDVEVTSNWWEPVVEYLDTHPETAAAMPKIKSYVSRNNFEYAGASGGFIDSYGYPFCRGRIFDFVEEDCGQYNSIKPVFWATGACMFIRSAVYEQAGGLDEEFFAHMEEIDLCWRIKLLGYQIAVIPESEVYHLGGGTLRVDSPRKVYLNFRNNLYMLLKNLPGRKVLPILFMRLILDGIAAVVYLINLKPRFFLSVFRAHLSFYFKIPKMYKKRKSIVRLYQNSSFNEMYKGCIVFRNKIGKITEFSQLNW